MSVKSSPVQSSPVTHEGSSGGTRSLLKWDRFVEKVGFEAGGKK